MSTNQSELMLRDMLERVWRNRDNIFVFQLLTIVLTLFIILFWPRTYGSEAQLFLQRGRESVGIDPTVATGQTIALQQLNRDNEITTAMEVLASRGVIEPVVDSIGPAIVLGHESLPGTEEESNAIAAAIQNGIGWAVAQLRKIDPASDRERAMVEIEKNLVIDAERKSEVIRVAYGADSPELAQHVVQHIVDEYTRKHPELHRTEGSTKFFEDQNTRLSEEFQSVSDRLSAAKNEIGLVSISEQTKILESQLGGVRSEILATKRRLEAANAKNKDLLSQLASTPDRLYSEEVSKPNHAADLQSQSLFDLKIRLSEAEAKFTRRHPSVQALRESVRVAEAAHNEQSARREEIAADINPIHEKLSMALTENKAEVAGLLAAAEELTTQEDECLTAIQGLNENSIAIRMLEVEAATAQNKLSAYGASLEDARVDEERKSRAMSSVTVSQPATLQEKPVSPSKPIVAILGALMCLAGSLFIALLSIQSDDTLISPYALAANLRDVPVIGSLPKSRSFSKVLA